jgi:hypothetical protein
MKIRPSSTIARRVGRSAALARARCPAWLGADETVRAGDEVSQGVGADTRQPNEHTRVVQVVFLQVIGTRIVLDERVSLGEVHHDDERIRLGGLMGRHTREHFPAHLQRGLAPGGCHLHVWQGTTDGFDGSERVATWHRRYATLSYVLADLLGQSLGQRFLAQ